MSDVEEQQFIRQITECQNQLSVYVFSLLGDADATRDVVQETNLVLWKRRNELTVTTEFATVACKLAYYQVLAYRRDRHRDRLLFDDELVKQLAEFGEGQVEQFLPRQEALRECLKKLTPSQRELIGRRYTPGMTTAQMSLALGRSKGSIDVTLHKIRKSLLSCIMLRISQEEG